MKICHLNCGSMREVDPAGQGPATPARALNHCLLVETDAAGLVLVETGFGTSTSSGPPKRSARRSSDKPRRY